MGSSAEGGNSPWTAIVHFLLSLYGDGVSIIIIILLYRSERRSALSRASQSQPSRDKHREGGKDHR